jgi:phospholipid transport system substrate-binding protein
MRTRRRRILTTVLLGLVLGAPAGVQAGPPTEQLRPAIDAVLRVLDDPALRGPTRTAVRRQAIRNVTDRVFAWDEMARRALGRHWGQLRPGDRQEFVQAFTELLERRYITKLEGHRGERIVLAGEELEGDRAVVRTQVLTEQGQKVAIDYRMTRRGDRWLVYDVLVENVGLVANYRSQFERILATSSYADLLRRMRGPGGTG